MSFLAPLFLLGGLAIGLPILFHFIRRATRERKVFSSLMFLLASPPRLTRRNRIEHLLLLLLRCAVICLVAIGFARPLFKQAMPPSAAPTGKRILLLVDTSASMRRANLWTDARNKVDSILHGATPGDQIALFSFDRQIKPWFTFEQWNATVPGERAALISGKLAKMTPGWGSTYLGNALIQAAETLSEGDAKRSTGHSRIELITDLQEGSHLEQLQGYEWPKGVEVSIDVLKARGTSNASLQLVDKAEDTDVKSPGGVRVRVSNAPGAKREQFKVGWALAEQSGFAGKPADLYVPAGQSRILSLPLSSTGSLERILLQGDDEEFDNLVFTSLPETTRLNVVYISTDAETNPKQGLYFLRRAFQETRHQAVSVTAHKPEELVSSSEAQACCLFVITAPLSNESAENMRAQALAGKTLLVIPRSLGMRQTMAQLLGIDGVNLVEAHPDNYAMLGEIDFRHAIFASFADPRFSDFTKIHFWKYCRLEAGAIPRARVLASFDSGDPALVEVPLGAGKALILTSGWEPESSQLALSSKFVPLLYSILEVSGAPEPLPAQYRVGDVVPLGAFLGTGQSQRTVHLPDGSQLNLAASETNFSGTDLPGVYTVASDNPVKKFVVNLDPSESRTTPLSLDELERLGVSAVRQAPSEEPKAGRKARLQNAELESRQKLWRWFIAGTLAVLLLETWLAGRTARRTTEPGNMLPS